VDEASRVENNNSNDRKGFYTVSEAAKALGVGQRRILEMLETNELEGERDPISSRWKIAKHAADELASEESSDTTIPLLTEKPPDTEKETTELLVTDETQATEETSQTEKPLLTHRMPREDSTEKSSQQSAEELRERIEELERLNERLRFEQQVEKAVWREEKESLLTAADRERQHAEGLQEKTDSLTAELATIRESIEELERLNERLRVEQEAEKATWEKEKEALLAAVNRELQHAEALQKEVARLNAKLEETLGLTSKLETINERLRLEQQDERAAWQEQKESLLDAADRERRHAEELQEKVEGLTAELETERTKRFWRGLLRK
jgi:excisionase family DNA binding protein